MLLVEGQAGENILAYLDLEDSIRNLSAVCRRLSPLRQRVAVRLQPTVGRPLESRSFDRQRCKIIYKLDVALRQLAACEEDVAEFLRGVVVLYTTTPESRRYLMLLLFPPTHSLSTGETLGNLSGRELEMAGLLNSDTGVIEVTPYASRSKSDDFLQVLLSRLLDRNVKFRELLVSYVNDTLNLEILYNNQGTSVPLYVAGATAKNVVNLLQIPVGGTRRDLSVPMSGLIQLTLPVGTDFKKVVVLWSAYLLPPQERAQP